jgi:hypothetical protein
LQGAEEFGERPVGARASAVASRSIRRPRIGEDELPEVGQSLSSSATGLLSL